MTGELYSHSRPTGVAKGCHLVINKGKGYYKTIESVGIPIPNFLYFYLLSNLWVHTYYDKSRVIKNIYFCNEQDTKYNFGDGWGDLWISAGQERGVLDKLRVQDEQRKIEEVVLFIADPSWCNFTTTQDQPNPIKLP